MQWIYLDEEGMPPKKLNAILVTDRKSTFLLIDIFVQNHIDFAIDFDSYVNSIYFNGYDIAKYITNKKIPMKEFRIHSNGPRGNAIRELLTTNGYREAV